MRHEKSLSSFFLVSLCLGGSISAFAFSWRSWRFNFLKLPKHQERTRLDPFVALTRDRIPADKRDCRFKAWPGSDR